MLIFRCRKETARFHRGVLINLQISRKRSTEISPFDFILLITRRVSELPLERGNCDLLDRGTELADSHGIFQRQRLPKFLLFRPMAILGSLIEPRHKRSIDSLSSKFVF